ncbi:PRL [Lemmus lemmus]
MTLRILRDWKDPLKHLVTELSAMPGVPDDILSKAKAIEDQHKIFLEHILKIVPKIYGTTENVDYTIWSRLASLKSSNEDVRCFAFYNLIRCLLRDSRRVNTFLEVLKYKLIQDKC